MATSKRAQKYIAMKTEHLMKKEGKTQNASLGQSYGMARSKFGAKEVPFPHKKRKKK